MPKRDHGKDNKLKNQRTGKEIDNQEGEIKELKKRSDTKMAKIKFIGVDFDPVEYQIGEEKINEYLDNGFEVLRDFQTAGGIVMALGKWEKEKTVRRKRNGTNKKRVYRFKEKVSSRNIPRYFLGFLMFLPVNYFVLPLFAETIASHSLLTAIQIGVIFSTISLIRKFTLRRWFERMRNCECMIK